MRRLQESIQLAKLDGSDVLYLAKVEAPSPVQMVSGPGVRVPAYSTGHGKSLMSDMSAEQVRLLLPEEQISKRTTHTIDNREHFIRELERVRLDGYALDQQEGVMGFCCVSTPIRRRNEIVAAVSRIIDTVSRDDPAGLCILVQRSCTDAGCSCEPVTYKNEEEPAARQALLRMERAIIG